MIDFCKLNDSQTKAVKKTDGPIMILAGAGSGKTRTLVSKINYLIEEQEVSPHKILAVTFSNKAAKEMRTRVVMETNAPTGSLQITTFHSFCAHLLRSEANCLGLSRNFTIYDDSESKTVVKSILARRGISIKEVSPFEVLGYMAQFKNNGYYEGQENVKMQIDKDDIFYSFYTEYESELHRSNAVDFGGLIVGVLQLFDKFPEVLERYQQRYSYILVDEYQDTNRAQYDLVKFLSEKHRNLCVVGDEDQSIYSWRGADIRNILDFEKDYPDTEVIKLEQNYRSSKVIIEAASCVISRNQMRKGKEMWTDRDQGEYIDVIENSDDRTEANFIGKEILILQQKNISLKDIAIFYRNNSQSRLIEDSLRKSNIPYRVIAGIKFYDRKEIKDLMSYVRLVVNSRDSLALSRIINTPTRGIGAVSLRKLEIEADRLQCSLWEVIYGIVNDIETFQHLKLSPKIRSALSSFVTIISEAKVLDESKAPIGSTFEKLLHESGYMEFLKSSKDYESLARIENVEELLNGIKQFEDQHKNSNLEMFLESITLDSQQENDEFLDQGEVSLMTVHGSKGLEFPICFITGVEENLFPSYRSMDTGDNAIEEERRLFYVAMTRAMEKLYISFASSRMLFGGLKFNGPSRFINEIPNKYYEWKRNVSTQHSSPINKILNKDHNYDEGKVFIQSKNAAKVQDRTQYTKGRKVIHAVYGEAKVLDTEGFGAEEKVLLRFIDGSRKKFMVKFAPLTII